jgi:TDG/mug DNA glycosylase family protein
VARATASADELAREELIAGRRRRERLVRRYAPRWVAVLGLGAYRTAFGRPLAAVGPQAESLAGAGLWVLPNPSGLNAHYRPGDFVRLFRELRLAADARDSR